MKFCRIETYSPPQFCITTAQQNFGTFFEIWKNSVKKHFWNRSLWQVVRMSREEENRRGKKKEKELRYQLHAMFTGPEIPGDYGKCVSIAAYLVYWLHMVLQLIHCTEHQETNHHIFTFLKSDQTELDSIELQGSQGAENYTVYVDNWVNFPFFSSDPPALPLKYFCTEHLAAMVTFNLGDDKYCEILHVEAVRLTPGQKTTKKVD